MDREDQDIIGSGQAARLLGVSRERVHQLERDRRLRATRGPYRMRLFRRVDVIALAQERERERARRR